jgi:succinate dehydrogenase / fumarate reductase, cytochrome b subunit
MRTRPLSPHLSVYRMSRYTLATSILNRFTGVALSAGLLLLAYWLMALAAGAHAYARARALLSGGPAKLLYAALIVAFCYHLAAGIRHLVWDTGRGLERAQARRSTWVVAVATLAMLLAIGYFTWLAGERTP